MERGRYLTCGAKRRYANDHDALRAGKRAFQARGHVTRVYACPYCGGFHLTSKGV